MNNGIVNASLLHKNYDLRRSGYLASVLLLVSPKEFRTDSRKAALPAFAVTVLRTPRRPGVFYVQLGNLLRQIVNVVVEQIAVQQMRHPQHSLVTKAVEKFAFCGTSVRAQATTHMFSAWSNMAVVGFSGSAPPPLQKFFFNLLACMLHPDMKPN